MTNSKIKALHIQVGISSTLAISAFAINILHLNEPGVGIIAFIAIQYTIPFLLFSGSQAGWWAFVIIYGLISILFFIFNVIWLNGTSMGFAVEVVMTLSVTHLIFHAPLRNSYLKRNKA